MNLTESGDSQASSEFYWLQKASAIHRKNRWFFTFLVFGVQFFIHSDRSLNQTQEICKYTVMENTSILHF